MKNNILKDISTLTTIPYSYLKNLSSKGEACICHSVLTNIKEGNYISQINIGVGDLIIFIEEDSISYKFIPSNKLEESLIQTVSTKQSPLSLQVEEALRDKIMSVYKELF